MAEKRRQTEILVIGSGVAGCSTALAAADQGCQVTLLNAGTRLDDGNSALAQGGIIYKAAESNDASSLEQDILVAGHNYNYRNAVRWLCENGPGCVEEMLFKRAPVNFDRNEDGTLNLTREGGHNTSRILHTADYTGAAIMRSLTNEVENHPNIDILPNRNAIDLLTTHHHARSSQARYNVRNRCLGAYVLNAGSGETETILARNTILATGGVGQVFLHTTNSPVCVGSGISMAYRAGVSLANLEFMQFHPTALYIKHSSRRPLVTEALRGEGGRLLDLNGRRFMKDHDSRGDLAPRDIVAAAMLEEMQHSGAHCLFLDVSEVKADLPARFPTVFEECLKIGIDIRKEPIPVVPAAHYFCGGILTDLYGTTSLDGLYAVGECACTGLHGANRLASTSLLEALVWGINCGRQIAQKKDDSEVNPSIFASIPDWKNSGATESDDPALVAQDWNNIRHTMWNYVGISRSTARLKRAFEDLRVLVRNIHEFYRNAKLSTRLLDLFHGSQTAYVITQAAMRNHSSIGCHHRVD